MAVRTYPPNTLAEWMRWMERRLSIEERRQFLGDGGGGAGPPGEGVPPGGSTGQVLTKASGNDFDTVWATPSGGTQTLAYRYTQPTASTTWTINHGLSFRPNVSVVDSTGTQIFPGSVVYTSDNQVVLTFSAAVGGEAYLS